MSHRVLTGDAILATIQNGDTEGHSGASGLPPTEPVAVVRVDILSVGSISPGSDLSVTLHYRVSGL